MHSRAFIAAAVCAVFASPAFAYNVRTTNKGKPIRWADGMLSIEIALDDTPDGVDATDAEAAALAAFATYTSALAGMTPDVELRLAMRDDAPAPQGGDETNVVRWVKKGWSDAYDPGALAVTLTSYDSTTGRITDADIVVNAADYPWSAQAGESGCRDAYDLQNVLTHEAGHLFGLAHDKDDAEATMFPSSGKCEVKKRDLDADDMAGLAHLYVETVAPVAGLSGAKALGCSVGSGAGGLFGLLLVVGMIAGRRRPRLVLALALGALVVPQSGWATTMLKLSLDDLSGDAVLVVRGVVGSVTTQKIGGHIYTDATLAVSECLKGTCAATLTIRQLGGELNGFGMHVEGTADLLPAGEVVLMLRRRLDDAYTPLGMAQGAFRVERDPKSLKITGLVHDGKALHYAKPYGGEEAGSVERVTMDELRSSLARAKALGKIRSN